MEHRVTICMNEWPQVWACFNCGQQRHKAVNCPQLRQNALTTQTTYPVATRHTTTTRPIKVGNQEPRTQDRVYTLTQKDAHTSNIVVIDIIPIFSIFAYTLFYIGASHSFVSHSFVSKFSVIVELLDVELPIDTPTRGKMEIDNVCKSCIIIIENRVLDLHSFRYA